MKILSKMLFISFTFILASLTAQTPPMGKLVESVNLPEKRNFPSDHIPVGVKININKNDYNIMTWNILNNFYLRKFTRVKRVIDY